MVVEFFSYSFEMLAFSLLVCREIEGQKMHIKLTNAEFYGKLECSDAFRVKYCNTAGIDSAPVIPHWLVFVQSEFDDLISKK